MDLPATYCSDIKEISVHLAKKDVKRRIFVYHYAPHLYFLFNEKNATSFDIWIPIYNSDEHAEKIISQLEMNKPELIIKDNYLLRLQEPTDILYWQFPGLDCNKLGDDKVEKFIMEHYQVIKKLNNFFILKLKM